MKAKFADTESRLVVARKRVYGASEMGKMVTGYKLPVVN